MKKFKIYLLLIIMFSILLIGCNSSNDNNEDNKEKAIDKWNAIPESHNFKISIDDNEEITIIGVKNLNLEDLVVPNIVSYIAKGVFNNCTELRSVVIPKSVKKIEEGAFSGCGMLESITLPFYGCMRPKTSDTAFYSFGYIFGKDSYEGGLKTFQYCSDSKDATDIRMVDFYIPKTL